MAGPGVKITGGDHIGRFGQPVGGNNQLWELFRRAVSQPSRQNDLLFMEQFKAQNPHSALFAGGGGASGTELRSAAAALSHSATALATAAHQLTASAAAAHAASVNTLLRQLGGTHPNRLSVPSVGGGPPLGGGGGGGRGGFGGGGFGGGFGRLPHHLGLGRAMSVGGLIADIAGTLGIGGIAGGALGLLAGIGYEGVRYKTQLGNLAMGFANEASPYARLTTKLFPFARAGGFSGQQLTNRFFPGNFQTPPWMAALGLGPEQAADILGQFGIAPQSTNQAESVVRTLRTLGLSPAFAGLPQGMSTQFQRSLVGLGVENGPGMGPATTRLAGVLEQAVAKGMDRAAIMRSIQSSLQNIGGRGIAVPSLVDFFANTMGRLGPGSRTGEAQLTALQGMQQGAQQLGGAGAGTTAAAMLFSNVKNRGDIAKIIGPHLLAQLEHNNPAIQLDEQQIIEAAKSGSIGLAFPALRHLLSSAHGLPMGRSMMAFGRRLFGPGFKPGSNVAQFDFLAGLLRSEEGARALVLQGHGGAPFAKKTTSFIFGNGPLMQQLIATGAPKALIDAALRAGRDNGVDPRMILAEAFKESQFKGKPHVNANGTVDVGPFQINSATAAAHGLTIEQIRNNPLLGAEIAGHILATKGIQGYNPHNPHEIEKFQNAFNQLFPGGKLNNLSPTFPMTASSLQDQMTGALQSFLVFGQHIEAASNGLSGFANGVDSATHAVIEFAHRLMATRPANAP